MANPHLGQTVASFDARIHNTKNRLVSIPARIQRKVGLAKQLDNHLLLISIRPNGQGRWNHHYVKLTFDNEFAIPSDVVHLQGGDEVEVKIHRIIADSPPPSSTPNRSGAGLILELNSEERPGWREDGSSNVDEYLNNEVRG
jgi:hypothetical protein